MTFTRETLMWRSEADGLGLDIVSENPDTIDPSAVIEPRVILQEGKGRIAIGARTRICAGAVITGPVRIGADCVIGRHAVISGPCVIGDDVRIGNFTEIRQTPIATGARIGPRCSLRIGSAMP